MTVTKPARGGRIARIFKVVDDAGRVWAHGNPAELYRWVSRRNDLLRVIGRRPTANAS